MILVIFGKVILEQKKIRNGLKTIYGISDSRANQICRDLGFTPELRIKNLTGIQQINLVKKIKNEYKVESNLYEERKHDIKVYRNNGSQRGHRLRTGLPVRGQRTHSNGKSARKRVKFT